MRTHPAIGEAIVRDVAALREARAGRPPPPRALRRHRLPRPPRRDRDPDRGAHRRRRRRVLRDDRDRPYSAARTHAEAAAELVRVAGSHLDPHVVAAMLAVLGIAVRPTLRVA